MEHALEVVQGGSEPSAPPRSRRTPSLGTVSVVGTGMASAPGYAALMFRTLFDHGINIELISTSDIRITCLVTPGAVPEAVRALHAAFDLDKP